MSQTPRRIHARLPCDLPVDIYSPVTASKLGEARVVNISMGGAAMESDTRLQRGVPYELRFTWMKDRLSLLARVAWIALVDPKKPNAPPRYGLSFNLSVKQEAALKALIDRLRLDHWPEGKETKRDYWSI